MLRLRGVWPAVRALAVGAKAAPRPTKIVLNDADLIESFVKGFGNGGQKINKTSNCVVLKHTPTGIVVKVRQIKRLE